MAAQELLASLSSQLPYHDASCIVSFESDPGETRRFRELASADAVIGLNNTQQGPRRVRTLEVLKMRGHSYLEGLHSMTITGDGISVFPRLATCLPQNEPPAATRREQFGLPEFDRMLGGGLPQFSTTMFFGDPGTGKTTFGLHYLLAGARVGEQGLLVTLNEPVPDLLLKADNLGLDLAAEVDAGRIHILRVPPLEINLDETAWTIRSMVEEWEVKRLVVDGLAELERAAEDLSYEADFLASLTEYLKRSGMTSVMLQDSSILRHDGGLESVSGPVAQNRIILRHVEYQGNLYRVCSILNMQASDHDTSIREFRIGQGGVTILEPSQSAPGVLAGITREQTMHEI
jgi:circadian clock protein KaiC